MRSHVHKTLKSALTSTVDVTEPEGSSMGEDFYSSLMDGQSSTDTTDALDRYLLSPVKGDYGELTQEPQLAALFRRFNTTVPSSASVERLFSAAGKVLRPERANISVVAFEAQLMR